MKFTFNETELVKFVAVVIDHLEDKAPTTDNVVDAINQVITIRMQSRCYNAFQKAKDIEEC